MKLSRRRVRPVDCSTDSDCEVLVPASLCSPVFESCNSDDDCEIVAVTEAAARNESGDALPREGWAPIDEAESEEGPTHSKRRRHPYSQSCADRPLKMAHEVNPADDDGSKR